MESFAEPREPPLPKTEQGIIELRPASPGLLQLVDERVAYGDTENVEKKVEKACRLFLNRNATLADKKNALRELADVLEFLSGETKEKLPPKEEDALFTIANNYGIRRWNEKQGQLKYNRDVYYPWILQSYLATKGQNSSWAILRGTPCTRVLIAVTSRVQRWPIRSVRCRVLDSLGGIG
jgi:hypothetical protein